MTTATETLVIQHEESVAVITTRCAGPNCANFFQEVDVFSVRRPFVPVELPSSKGWWLLCQPSEYHGEKPSKELSFCSKELSFCSWDCVKNTMLGMPPP